jgi:hypothetical protein
MTIPRCMNPKHAIILAGGACAIASVTSAKLALLGAIGTLFAVGAGALLVAGLRLHRSETDPAAERECTIGAVCLGAALLLAVFWWRAILPGPT